MRAARSQIATNCVGGYWGYIVARLLHCYASSWSHFEASGPTWVRKVHWDPNRNDQVKSEKFTAWRRKCAQNRSNCSDCYRVIRKNFCGSRNSMQKDSLWLASPNCSLTSLCWFRKWIGMNFSNTEAHILNILRCSSLLKQPFRRSWFCGCDRGNLCFEPIEAAGCGWCGWCLK